MKRLVFFTAILSLILSGCNDNDGYSLNDWYATIGNVQGDYPSYTIHTDGGTVLFPSASAVSTKNFEDGDRMFVYFTILGDGSESDSIDHYIKLNDYQKILTKGIIELTEENADSIGNDPIWFSNAEEEVWIANNYLNVSFLYEGAPWTTHYINLVSDINNPTNEDGVPVFEIRHNANGDSYNNPPLRAFVSFDLKELQADGQSETTFIIKSTGRTGSENFEKEFTYSYGTAEETATETFNIKMDEINRSVR